jgi:hypothetical protein
VIKKSLQPLIRQGFNHHALLAKLAGLEKYLASMTGDTGVRPLQASSTTPLLPEDLDALQRVFDRLCHEYRWSRESAQAQRYGRMLIQEYQAGTRDERLLLRAGHSLISRSHAQRRALARAAD